MFFLFSLWRSQLNQPISWVVLWPDLLNLQLKLYKLHTQMLPLTCADCYLHIVFIIHHYVWLITEFYKFIMAHHWALFCCSQLLKNYSVCVDRIIFYELSKLMSKLDLVVRIHFFFKFFNCFLFPLLNDVIFFNKHFHLVLNAFKFIYF